MIYDIKNVGKVIIAIADARECTPRGEINGKNIG